ncbi:HNH endonuclease signature motif containing protein [Morganella morganii]|uniref:HNH endonuclease signature motif containing protein n=1 Tax=Morganella morganii TaxID=582 RepID=UPI0038668AB8
MKWIKCNCEYCGTSFMKLKAEIKRTGRNLCSRQCSGKLKAEISKKNFLNRYKKVGECWEWTGTIGSYGYGMVGVNGKRIPAHRYMYEIAKGEIPKGAVIMHSCDNPACINPDHLSVGTHTDNMRDMVNKGRHNHKVPRSEYSKIATSCKSNKELAEKYNVSERNVRRIKLLMRTGITTM